MPQPMMNALVYLGMLCCVILICKYAGEVKRTKKSQYIKMIILGIAFGIFYGYVNV